MNKIYDSEDNRSRSIKSLKNATNTAKKSKINVISSDRNKSGKTPSKTKAELNRERLRKRINKTPKENAVDLEILDQNIKTRSNRGIRNKTIIIVLSVLIAVVLIAIAVFASGGRSNGNCDFYVKGDGKAAYIVDGKEMNSFKLVRGISGNRIVEIDTELKITSLGNYDVIFWVEVYQNSTLLEGIDLLSWNASLFERRSDGKYYSRDILEGNEIYHLFNGVAIPKNYEQTLNDKNFSLKVYTEMIKK